MTDERWANTQLDNRTDFDAACRLLDRAKLFDNDYYLKFAGDDLPLLPIEHYLRRGWTKGLEPSEYFHGHWLYPYYVSAGLEGPPALTYATLQAAGAPVYPTEKRAERTAKIVRESELFDPEYYSDRVGDLDGLDPALHYVVVGERLGYAPSTKFDPLYYMRRYQDVGLSPMCMLEQYIVYGKNEGRRRVSIASDIDFNETKIDPTRETVLIISHQASRTGAPILAYNIAKRLRQKYNIVTLILQPGELTRDFEAISNAVIGPIDNYIHPVEGEYIANCLKSIYSVKYAIVNSIDSRLMLKPLMCAMIPSITLVHEFAADLRQNGEPAGEMGRWLEWTNEIVFSANIVANSVRTEYPHLDERPVHILPQGPCELPPRPQDSKPASEHGLRQSMRPAGSEDAILVLGCGTIFPRKGVDLFVECAARVSKIAPKHNIRFVWIGRQFKPEFLKELQHKIGRSPLPERISILDEVTNLDEAYASANIFFLSSRLDPLPNVGIDSALRGIPIVCFDQTGGIADLLNSDKSTHIGVVPYLEVDAAAKTIIRLAKNRSTRQKFGRSVQQMAETIFNIDHYVDRLDQLGRKAERSMHQRLDDFDTIMNDDAFDMCMFLEPTAIEASREEAIRLFLARAAALSTSTQPNTNFYFRRPCPGFHPQIYIHENSDRYDTTTVNPLAHFIRSGKPDGPWRHDVIFPSDSPARPASPIRVAIHAHFHYPELSTDFMEKLMTNSGDCDLLLSTDNMLKATLLKERTKDYQAGAVDIRIVPNRGRDIGAFFTGFAREIRKYDIVGHLHAKRSLHTGDSLLGERWREFLWQHLLGGLYPMMDTVIEHFSTNHDIGIVFADDPHLSDWDSNREVAERLAQQMGWTRPLPSYFDFPVGTMFWVRPEAFEPIWRLNLSWHDYPEEPLPIDGSMLHALERMLPSVVQEAGFRYATTFIAGVTW